MIEKEQQKSSKANIFDSVDEFNKTTLVQHKNEINELKRELEALKLLNQSLTRSLSYRIGRFVTFPIRFIVNLFSKKKVKPNPIKATCDGAFYADGFIDVTGWSLSDSEIIGVELFLNGISVGSADLGIFREDVMHAFADVPNSQFAGFSAIIKGDLQDDLEIIVTDAEHNSVKVTQVIIPETRQMSLNAQYQIYLQQNNHNQISSSFEFKPLISIIVPVYNVSSKWLNACINSVMAQTYQNWQLCLYDDASNNEDTIACLTKWQGKDDRINIAFGKENKGISLASNEAINLAKGEFIALLDHDDELTVDALLHVIQVLNKNQNLDFIYSDEDKINSNGVLCDPHFKSDFNLSTLLSWNYICHFMVIKKSIGDQLNWFRQGFEGAQDHDLALRVLEKTHQIHHIPHVLYHWRKVEGSTAIATNNKSYAQIAGKKAVFSSIKRQNIDAQVEDGLFPNSYRVKYAVNESKLVSIIIPFKNQLQLLKGCINSILQKTQYQNYEILLVNNQSDETTVDYCKKLAEKHKPIQLLHFDEKFNFSRLNNYALSTSQGDYVLFLNNDTQVINKGWLTEMVAQIQQHKVAAVGAKLLYEDNTIQHCGVVVNKIGAMHPNKGLDENATGYFQRANYVQHISACTGACLLVNKEVFLEVGGFDEEKFAIAYNDVDLCLRMRQSGYLITYTPYAKLYHYESKSRGYDNQPEKIERFAKELKNYQQKWGEIYKDGDPYFNPNFMPNSEKICLNIK